MLRLGLLTSIGETLDAFFVDYVQHWRRNGWIVSPAAGTPARRIDASVIPGLSQSPSITNVRALRELDRWGSRQDVILTNTATASALIRMTPQYRKTVYFCHGLHWNPPVTGRDLPWVVLEKSLASRTMAFVSLNTDDQAWFSQFPQPQLYLESGVGLDLARYPWSPQPQFDGELRLTWIGAFSPRKDPLAAVEVVDHLINTFHQRVYVTMMGDGVLAAATRRLILQRGLEASIQLHSRGDAAAAIGQAHAVLHTAHWEGLPRVLLEATSIGRPCYAWDSKGTKDIPGIRLASPARSPLDLAALIHSTMALSTQQPAEVRSQLDWRQSADQLQRFLAGLSL